MVGNWRALFERFKPSPYARRQPLILVNGLSEQSESWFRNHWFWRRHFDVHMPNILVYEGVALHRRIEEGLPIDKEFYLGIVLDRASGRPVFMASAAGGMDIEEVAAKTPEKIFKETIDPAVGFRPFQARKLAFALGLTTELISQAAKFMQALYQAYESMDASLLEINPFLLTKDNRLIALDAKVNFDDNALFRHS